MKNIIKLTSLILSLLLAKQAEAQTCVTPPNCEVLGYDKTALDCGLRPVLKCPFDQNKVYCGVYVDKQGNAICEVGDILFADKTCSSVTCSSDCPDCPDCTAESCLNYIAAGRTPIGVVINSRQRLAISLSASSRSSLDDGKIDGLQLYDNASLAKSDYNGFANTKIIADKYPNGLAGYCYNYSTVGTKSGDWYQPAMGELYGHVYTNKEVINKSLKAMGFGGLSMGDSQTNCALSSTSYSRQGYWWCLDGNSRFDTSFVGRVFCAIVF